MSSNADLSDLPSRIASGFYKVLNLDSLAESFFISGKLHYVIEQANIRAPNSKLQYLVEDDGQISWHDVSVNELKHYHGPQKKLLLHFLYLTECALSQAGEKRFSNITGLSPSRIHHALRRADAENYSPFSEPAMIYIGFRVTEFLNNKGK